VGVGDAEFRLESPVAPAEHRRAGSRHWSRLPS